MNTYAVSPTGILSSPLNKEQRVNRESDDVAGVSVVTPTHGRDTLLPTLLASLQTARRNTALPTEILIVDSSPQAEATVIREACDRFGARYIQHTVNNVRQKRNRGIEEAHYPVVLFIDSDCQASPQLINEHAQGYSDGVGGVVGLTRFIGQTSWVWCLIERTSVLDSFSYARRMETAPWGPTCNISYRKKALEAVGKFDTSFPFRLGGDDVDLGLRITDSGYTIKCNPEAVVEHTRDTWSRVTLIGRRLFRWGRMHYHLMRKHPRRIIYDFPKSSGIFFLLFLVLLPLAMVWLRPGVLILPVLWLIASLLIETLLMYKIAGTNWRDFGYFIGARMLGLTFETGTLLEALNHGSIQPFYKEIYYTQPSTNSPGRNRRIIQLWASILAMLALIPLCVWL